MPCERGAAHGERQRPLVTVPAQRQCDRSDAGVAARRAGVATVGQLRREVAAPTRLGWRGGDIGRQQAIEVRQFPEVIQPITHRDAPHEAGPGWLLGSTS